jgi:carboxyl-terminal processing protease
MKKKLFLLLIPAAIIGLLSFSVFQVPTEDSNKERVLKDLIFQGLISQVHYNNLPLDDNLSGKAFDLYMERLDAGKRFFMKSDIEKLSAFRNRIDDEIRGAQSELLPLAMKTWDERMKEAKTYTEEILNKPFDFTTNETIEFDPKKRDFYASKAELKEEWRKYLTYQALIRFHARQETEKKKQAEATKKGETYTAKTDAELEKAVRDEVSKNMFNMFDRLGKMDTEDKTADYLNAILGVYEPHTEYFPPQEKENFDIEMSGRLEGIGAQLSLVDGEIKIVSIVPGSASWRQGTLKEEDIILKVAQGEEEPVSVENLPLKEAIKYIRGPKGTEVKVTVRKPDGRIVTVPIVRDVVVLEESYAKAAVLYNESTKQKTGYIYLPSFYADFSGKGGRSSAEDVKILLNKLKKENIQSVILDLRFNGGGSLQDAIDMSGLFIKDGPVVQVRSKKGDPVVLEDRNPEIVWDGPLAIMTNEFSASASEILAAAMQDYGRAVVIGSKSSFGKGTVQRFFDLDYYLPANLADVKPLGSVKMTIQKFYRITGKATQWKGVESDIVLPDTYSEIELGESSLDYAMAYDEIKPKTFKTWGVDLQTEILAKNSAKRLKNNEVFKLIEENAVYLKEQREKTSETLNLTKFIAEQEALEKQSEKFKNLSKVHEDLVVTPIELEDNLDGDLKTIRNESAKKWQKEVRENVYIYETSAILHDYIKSHPVAATNTNTTNGPKKH